MSAGGRVLLVEDEKSLAAGLEFNLTEEGYSVTLAADGRKALELFEVERFDLLILDITLPYIDGYEVARRVRLQSPRVPILMLTARASGADRVRGLGVGADDYLTKPFHLEEFLLRVKGMLRRKGWYLTEDSTDRAEFGSVQVDFGDMTGSRGEAKFAMTPLEASLLRYFVEHARRIVSRGELLEEVWNVASGIETRSVENFVVRLRRLIESDPTRPTHIRTVRGAGYLFSPDGAG